MSASIQTNADYSYVCQPQQHVVAIAVPVCVWANVRICVSFWQNVVLETTTVAGTTTEADLSAFADVHVFVYLSP